MEPEIYCFRLLSFTKGSIRADGFQKIPAVFLIARCVAWIWIYLIYNHNLYRPAQFLNAF